MLDTKFAATGPAPSSARTDTPDPAPPQQTAPDRRPPLLAVRMPQAGALFIPPASGDDVLAHCATASQLQPPAELLNMPKDLLQHLTSVLRTANTRPAIRSVARFRAACKVLQLRIPEPIPDGMMGLIEFNRLEALKQMLAELQQSGKDVAKEVNTPGILMKIRDPELQDICLTPLMAAACLGHAELVTVLVKAGASVDQVMSRWTALLLAARQGHTECVNALTRLHARVDDAGPRARTGLMLAAEQGHTATVQALLQAGARVDQVNLFGGTALSYAAAKGHTASVQALLQAGARANQATS